MATQDPLSELADIHLPGEIALWPPAIGWWLLLGIAIICLAYAKRRYVQLLIKRKRVNSALNTLDEVLETYQQQPRHNQALENQAGLTFLHGLNSTLRRVALLQYPQFPHISQLTGKAWLNFLDECGASQEFSTGSGKILAEGVYQRTFTSDANTLHELARNWIEQRYQEKPEQIKVLQNQLQAPEHNS